MRLLLPLIICILLVACNRRGSEVESPGTPIVTLSLPQGDEIANPSDEQIREILSRFDMNGDEDAFAILHRSEMTYMQVSGDKAQGFLMEYQEGDIQKHYQAERQDFTIDEVVKALTEYRDGEVTWSDYGDWKRLTW